MMTDIRHRIRIVGTLQAVYDALATIEGLKRWWTSTTSGASSVGDSIDFHFGSHTTTMRVDTLSPTAIEWTCTESHPDWIGTRITFELIEDKDGVHLNFGHRDWREATDFQAHCSMKWATFLLSLKADVETGAGRPFPKDISIG